MNPAVAVAKNGKVKAQLNERVQLSTGYEVILKPVPAMLIEEAQNRIKEPKVPIQELDDGRQLENPNDPDYLNAQRDVFRQRAQAGIDTMVIFGIELVEGMPDDDDWLNRLKFMARRGLIELGELGNMEDSLEREFVFKKYIVMGNDDWMLLSRISGVSEEDIAQAKESFQSSQARRTN